MNRYVVKDKKTGKPVYRYENGEELGHMDEWGKPERWVPLKNATDEEIKEQIDSKIEDGVESIKLAAEYEVEVTNIDKEIKEREQQLDLTSEVQWSPDLFLALAEAILDNKPQRLKALKDSVEAKTKKPKDDKP